MWFVRILTRNPVVPFPRDPILTQVVAVRESPLSVVRFREAEVARSGFMFKRSLMTGAFAVAALALGWMSAPNSAKGAPPGQPSNWQRFYYYPYVYYPHNFQPVPESYNHMYYRYPAEKQIPVYNKDWHNFYPNPRPYHWGHHFILDTI